MGFHSMTGFGGGLARSPEWRVDVELGTVNRKQFDLSLSLPRDLAALEPRLHARVHARIIRGHVKGTVRVRSLNTTPPWDTEDLRQQVAALRRLAAELGLRDDLTASCLPPLTARPSDNTSGARDALLPTLEPLVEQALDQALDAIERMRAAEGFALQNDLRNRLETLRGLREGIRIRAPSVSSQHREALLRRLREASIPFAADDPALLRELALFADRCDISEELTRLDSHFAQAEGLLGSQGPCGRELDFLCQELFREINTIASKANDAGLTALAVRFKAELEAFREQVQNVE